MRSALLLALSASLLLAISPAFAQTGAAKLTGTVTDPSGAVIPGAVVKIVNEKTGAVRELPVNELGVFTAPNLAPSLYTVSASSQGMAVTEYTHIPLAAGQERNVALLLAPAQVQQSVTVSGGDLVVIDTSSACVGANVNEREVANMPLNGRQLSQLYLLAPGAQTAGGGSFDNIRFSGRANQQNAVRFDGVEASSIVDASPGNLNGESSTGFRLQASLENVQEFRVESSNYPAEYGTGTAGQITVVTKSGSNAYHGSAFEYLRNNKLDARNFFDAEKSPLRLNQYGGSIGGPIQKDKLFFFGSIESLRQRAGINLVESVPSAAARARAVDSIKPLMAAYPTGTQSTANADLDVARLNASNSIDEYFGSLKLDYTISPKYVLSMRYMRDQGYLTSPLGVTGNYQRVTAVPQNALVSLQQVLSPSVINETKFGFNGQKTRINGVADTVNGIDLSAISVNFTGSVAIPGIGGQGTSAGAATLGGLIRSNSSQNGRAQPYTSYTMSFIDNLTWLKGNHSFKFGAEFRPVRMYTDRLGGTTYTFSNLNDLLANRPSGIQILGDVSAPNPLHNGIATNRYLKQQYSIFYAQDEWRIRPNLTLNYGLRYEYYSPLRENQDLYTLFIVEKGDLATGDWYKSSKTNFGPRLALSWSPTRFNNKTVLRIGAGYYYGPGQTEDQIQPIDSDRVTVNLTNTAFPVNSQQIIASVDPSKLSGFQPRAYSSGYTLPEKVLSYTASIQQQLPGNVVLTVAYVGSQGRNLFLRSWTNGIVGVTMNPTTGAGNPVLQFGSKFAQLDYKTSGGTDHYDSMQTSVQRRFSKGLTIGGQWTYGHSLGNTGGSNEAQTAQNPFNFEADRGNNAFDLRHSVNVSALYELPLGKGHRYLGGSRMADLVFGGWQMGGVLNARTGLPVDITIARNDIAYQVNSTGQIVSNPIVNNGVVMTTPVINNPYGGAFRNNRRPDVVAGVNPFLVSSDRRYFLNPAAFAFPQAGSFGNLGRWAVHGPGLSQFDLTLQKRFQVSEKLNVEFRSEIYNLLNRANFSNPPARLNNALGVNAGQLQPGQPFSLSAAGGTFGIANSTVTKDVGLGASRQIQMSLRFNF
jgi:hypothetical protein